MNVSKTRKYETAANLLRQKRQAAATTTATAPATDKSCTSSDPVKSSREITLTTSATTCTTVTVNSTSVTRDTHEANRAATSRIGKSDPSADSDASSIVTTSSCSCEDHSDADEVDDAHKHSSETSSRQKGEQSFSNSKKENCSQVTAGDQVRSQEYKIKKPIQSYTSYVRSEGDHGRKEDDTVKVTGQGGNHNHSHKTIDSAKKRKIYSPATSSSSSPHLRDRSTHSRYEEFDLHHERSGMPGNRPGGSDQRLSNRTLSHSHHHQETLYDRHGHERHLLDDRKRKHYNSERDFIPSSSSSSSYHRAHRSIDERNSHSSFQQSKSRYEQSSNHHHYSSRTSDETKSHRNRSHSAQTDDDNASSRKRYRTNYDEYVDNPRDSSRHAHSSHVEHRSSRSGQLRDNRSNASKQSPGNVKSRSHSYEKAKKKEAVDEAIDTDDANDCPPLHTDRESVASNESGKAEDENDTTNGTVEPSSDDLRTNDKVNDKTQDNAKVAHGEPDVDSVTRADKHPAVSNHRESNGGNSKLKSTLVKVTPSSVKPADKSDESKTSRLAVKSYHDLLSYFFKDAIYFIMKSNIQENIDIAMAKSLWSTPALNEAKLNYSFIYYRNVILIFSTKESGKFAGFARLSSPLKSPPNGRVNWILPNGMNEETFFNGAFELDWICKNDLLFTKTSHLFNPLNEGKPVKIARDGQQVDNAIAEQLISLFPQDHSIDLIPLLKKMKRQTKNRPSIMPPMVSMVPMMIHPTTNGYGSTVHPPDGNRRERLSVHHRLGPKLASRLGPPPVLSPSTSSNYDPYHRSSGHWKRR